MTLSPPGGLLHYIPALSLSSMIAVLQVVMCDVILLDRRIPCSEAYKIFEVIYFRVDALTTTANNVAHLRSFALLYCSIFLIVEPTCKHNAACLCIPLKTKLSGLLLVLSADLGARVTWIPQATSKVLRGMRTPRPYCQLFQKET